MQACVLKVSLKVFQNGFICHMPGNSAKKNSIVGTMSLLNLLLELRKEVPGPSAAGALGRISATGCSPLPQLLLHNQGYLIHRLQG